MRLLAVVCFFTIAINYLGSIQGVDGNIHFSLNGVTSQTYSKFIEELRAELTQGTQPSHGIRVLHESVPNSGRFILVDLTNYDDRTITVAIDVINVYVVGYCVVNTLGKARFYYLNETDVPFNNLFPDIKGTDREKLEFTGSYTDLQRVAHRDREEIPLGGSPLNSAIDSLLYNSQKRDAVAQSLTVIIQMVSEVARFGFIERQIGGVIQGDRTYTPGSATLSLENEWSTLSTQIQNASADGEFKIPVELRDTQNRPFSVKDVKTATSATRIALLLYWSMPASISTM